MGCTSCGEGGKPNGCKSNGSCGTASCNKMNTFDWLSDSEIYDPTGFKIVEVSFKQGATKNFYINDNVHIHTGDVVAVDGDKGYNVGEITLSGELVRMQLKKKAIKANSITAKVLRIASERDLQKLQEARDLEIPTLIRARVIARNLSLEMKIGDIEYQADKRKATFYYTAEGRVDFRELVKHYSEEFKIKVEMRQIGSRQESARIGGLGSCGRELCCSTWLSKFKSVSTTAARYQNLSINQTKLSGQCGRLKCCLNYELDTYLEILQEFPKKVDYLKTKQGKVQLIKMDIFKGLMFYAYANKPEQRGVLIALEIDRVKEIKKMNQAGDLPDTLLSKKDLLRESQLVEDEISFADVTGQIELPTEKKKSRNKRRNNKRKPRRNSNTSNKPNQKPKGTSTQGNQKRKANKPKNQRNKQNPNQKNKSTGSNPTENKSAGNKSAGNNKNAAANKPKSDNKRPPRSNKRRPHKNTNKTQQSKNNQTKKD